MEALSPTISALIGLLLVTSFLKIFTSLNILRYGIGLEGGSFGVVILGVSLALTFVVMTPQIERAGGITSLNSEAALEKNFTPFLIQHTHQDILARLKRIGEGASAKDSSKKDEGVSHAEEPVKFSVLVASFVLSELKEAFQLAILLLIPFVVIDLLVVNVMMAVGITQMPHIVVALPLKLLLFVAVDGWTVISEKLLNGYF